MPIGNSINYRKGRMDGKKQMQTTAEYDLFPDHGYFSVPCACFAF